MINLDNTEEERGGGRPKQRGELETWEIQDVALGSPSS